MTDPTYLFKISLSRITGWEIPSWTPTAANTPILTPIPILVSRHTYTDSITGKTFYTYTESKTGKLLYVYINPVPGKPTRATYSPETSQLSAENFALPLSSAEMTSAFEAPGWQRFWIEILFVFRFISKTIGMKTCRIHQKKDVMMKRYILIFLCLVGLAVAAGYNEWQQGAAEG